MTAQPGARTLVTCVYTLDGQWWFVCCGRDGARVRSAEALARAIGRHLLREHAPAWAVDLPALVYGAAAAVTA